MKLINENQIKGNKSMKKSYKKSPLTVNKIAENVTANVLACLKKGTIPWKSGILNNTEQISFDNKPYEGLNQWMLVCSSILNDFRANKWITFNRCRKEGGNVLKGSKSVQLTYWAFKYIADKECDACLGKAKTKEDCPCGRTIPMPKAFNVFNIEQTSLFDEALHIPQTKVKEVDVNLGMADNLIAHWNEAVDIRYGYANLSCPYYLSLIHI